MLHNHPLDQLIHDDSLFFLEAMIPFVDYAYKKTLILLIKYQEIRALRPPGLCCLLRVRLSPGKFRRNDGMHVPFPAGRFCRQYQEHAADAQNDAGHAGDE